MDAPSPWELQRNYDRLREDVRSGFASMNTRLDRVPTAETLTALIGRLDDRLAKAEKDVGDLEVALQRERDNRGADRRLVVGSILAAVGSLVVMIVSSLIGGGPT
jgi:hypothetical protein